MATVANCCPFGGISTHSFADLIERSTNFALNVLNKAGAEVTEALQNSAATSLVKTLQMIQLQKVIMAVGMFSIFESIVQDRLDCSDGFEEARKCLHAENEAHLKRRFSLFVLASNALKHGRGRSYDALLAENDLPFLIKRPDENFFSEGDVSEVSTLIQVDDQFVLGYAQVIQDASSVIARVHPGAL